MRVFNETQGFNQWLMKLIYIGIGSFLLYSLYMWFIVKEPVGNVNTTDVTGQLFILCTTIPILLLFYMMRLKTTIDEIGIHYQFLPFQFSKKIIRWADIKECFVREYQPITEYGGWGVRGISSKNKAYNVKGNKGIQIVLKNGNKILIGTQKESNANTIIKRYLKTEQ